MNCGVEPGKRCTYCAKAGLSTCNPVVAKMTDKPKDKAVRQVKNK